MTTKTNSFSEYKLRMLFFGLLLLPLWSFAQDYNGGFEELHPAGTPIGWTRTEVSATAVTSGAYSGDKAIKAWINDFYRVGIWSNYSPETVAAHMPGAKADKIPGNLSGFYWYDGSKSECETALITVFAGRQGANGSYDTLAYSDQELRLNKKFEPFSFDVNTRSGAVPDFVSIQIEPRGKCYYRGSGKCCYLTVDELRFDQDIENVEAKVKAEKSPWTKAAVAPVRVNPDRIQRRKKRKSKRLKRKKRKKGRGITGPFKRRKNTSPTPPEPPATPPPAIQKEIDRINKYQKENTPDEAEKEEVPTEADSEVPQPEIDLDRLKMSEDELLGGDEEESESSEDELAEEE